MKASSHSIVHAGRWPEHELIASFSVFRLHLIQSLLNAYVELMPLEGPVKSVSLKSLVSIKIIVIMTARGSL